MAGSHKVTKASQSYNSWWRHQMETFSALLAIYAGNSPVIGEFPAQRPVTRRFDVFFDLHLCHRAHYDVTVMLHRTPHQRLCCASAFEHGSNRRNKTVFCSELWKLVVFNYQIPSIYLFICILKDIIDYTLNSSFNRFTSFHPPERDMNRISLPLYHAYFPTWSTPIHGIWSKFLTYFRQGHNLLRILVTFMKTIILQDIIQNHNLSFAFANKLSKCIILSRK